MDLKPVSRKKDRLFLFNPSKWDHIARFFGSFCDIEDRTCFAIREHHFKSVFAFRKCIQKAVVQSYEKRALAIAEIVFAVFWILVSFLNRVL